MGKKPNEKKKNAARPNHPFNAQNGSWIVAAIAVSNQQTLSFTQNVLMVRGKLWWTGEQEPTGKSRVEKERRM